MDDLDIEDNVSSIPQELTSFATKDYTESQPTESVSSESFEEIVHYDSSSMREMKHIILTEPSNMDARPDKRNNIRNYLEMVREKDDFKCKPEWDSCQKSIDMDVIKTSNNFKFVSKLLEMKSQMRIDMRDKRNVEINDLMNDQRYFGHLFEVFDKFVKENIEKRERAIDKIKSERALRAELDQEIIKVVSGAQRLAKLRLDIRQEINRNKMFVDFLETVRELAPNHFRNGVTDIIDRYQVLRLTHAELAKEQEEALNKIQSLGDEMFKITDDHVKEVIHLRNKFTELTCRYDCVKHEAVKWESLVNKIESLTAHKMTEIFEVKYACYVLYSQICEYLNKPLTIAKDDVRGQLMFIEENIILLRDALNAYRRRPEKNKKEARKIV